MALGPDASVDRCRGIWHARCTIRHSCSGAPQHRCPGTPGGARERRLAGTGMPARRAGRM